MIAGDPAASEALAATLHAHELAASPLAADDPGTERSEIGSLAHNLVALEGALASDRPTAVLVADGGDLALAATLVATKLLIPVAVVAPAPDGAPNGPLLAQLADESLPADGERIAAWVGARPTLPGR